MLGFVKTLLTRARGRRGLALVTVLWVLMLLGQSARPAVCQVCGRRHRRQMSEVRRASVSTARTADLVTVF